MKRKSNILLLVLSLVFQAVVFAQQKDSLEVPYNYIDSSPQNADVYFNNEHLGRTPLFFTWKDSIFPGQLRVTAEGYTDHVETIHNAGLIKKFYSLVRIGTKKKSDLVIEGKNLHFEEPRKIFPIVISSLAAVGAGISAFHFKSLALENRDIYDQSGDPGALDKKKKYDIISGISLAVFQLGMGALIYFLLLE